MFLDSATLSFQPLIDLTSTPFSNLSAQAAVHWLELDSTSPSQWGAFMHFYGPTRKLLKAGGLSIEAEDFTKIKSSNKKWDALVNNYLAGNLCDSEALYLVRLLYYLGFYCEGTNICAAIIHNSKFSNANNYWALYLKNLGESIENPLSWQPSSLLVNHFKSIKQADPLLGFHIGLLISKFFIRLKRNAPEAAVWLNQTEEIINNYNYENKELSILRLSKYKSDNFILFSNSIEARNILIQSLDNIKTLSKVSCKKFNYLFSELQRRLLDALVHIEVDSKNCKAALNFALEAINVDPYCSRALSIASSIALTENKDLAYSLLGRAASCGIIERSYAKAKLSELVNDNFSKHILIDEAVCNSLASEKGNCQEQLNTIEHPSKIYHLQNIASLISEQTIWEKIRNSSVYQKFLPFWDLKKPIQCHPLACYVPLVALDAFKTQELSYYQTNYLQRTLPSKFRQELFCAVSPHTLFSQANLHKSNSVEILINGSNHGEQFLDYIRTSATAPIRYKILLARLLGALGFYKDALNILPQLNLNDTWSFEEEYAYYTKLCILNIICAPLNDFPYSELEKVYAKLSNDSESLRTQWSLTILAMVFNGQRKNIEELKIWKDRGYKVLLKIQDNNNFDEFEKQILTSRFYRASSYYPFLIKDHKALRIEAEICESLARSLIPNCEKQSLIKKENLFPMLESMSRIYYALGETDRSLKLMGEIVEKVDPYDSKAWVQFGELNERLGYTEKAKSCYQEACLIKAPLGGIAWYRLGRLYEKELNNEEALACYFRSMTLYPNGLSPLIRIKNISQNQYISSWCEKNLSEISLKK